MIEHGAIFGKGLFVGFSLAMILGPIGIFCIQQTLRKGFYAGLAAGLGAATADGMFGALAGFGLTYICDFLMHHEKFLHIAGGGFLIYLGIENYRRIEISSILPAEKTNLFALFSTTFFLTLANPMTILVFTALLAGLGIGNESCGTSLAFALFIGIFLGSLLWWIILTGSISAFRVRISMNLITRLNKIAGIAIAVFGLLILLKVLPKFF